MKIGFIASPFDLGPHAGHCMALREAKEHCDYLIAGLNTAPEKGVPVCSVSERFITASSNKYINEVIPYESESDLLNLLNLIKPDIRFLGQDYIGKSFTGEALNIPIHYCKRTHNLSTTELKRRIYGSSTLSKT